MPRRPEEKKTGAWVAWVLFGLFLLLCAPAWPGAGITIGLVALASGVAWIGWKSARPKIEAFYLVKNARPAALWASVVAGILWSTFLVFLSSKAIAVEREQELQALAAAEEQERKTAAEREERAALAEEIRSELEEGEVDEAILLFESGAERLGIDSGLREVAGEIEEAVHQRDLDNLPATLTEILKLNAEQSWADATSKCAKALELDAEFEGLKGACEAAEDGERLSQIPGWLENAKAVYSDKAKCGDPSEVDAAVADLDRIEKADPGHRKALTAKKKLKRCRKQVARALSKQVSKGKSKKKVKTQSVAGPRTCCRVCRTGKPCGDSCISRSKTCRKGPGCAC